MNPEYFQNSPVMLGNHEKIREIIRIVNKTSATSSAVLIIGESGTGKESLARAIHNNSLRRGEPFVIVNCAGVSDSKIEMELFGYEKGVDGAAASSAGAFEMANGGTIFFEDISELNKVVQSKLFRVLQDKHIYRIGGKNSIPVDVRVITASIKELVPEIKHGNFREDLFYRLNVISLNIPSLRERGNDIAMLASDFVKKFSQSNAVVVHGISPNAIQVLTSYQWPGNVRQLESVIESTLLMASGDWIEPDDLPTEITSQFACTSVVEARFILPAKGINFEEFEKDILEQAMERADGVIGKAAPLLGMTYKTLQYRLDKFGIKRPDHRCK